MTDNLGFYGTPGLIEMPTAESAPDANLTGAYTSFAGQSRTTLSFQITPRLSGSFRYSKIPEYNPNGTDRFDRSFDLQYQLLDEGKYRPAVAIGLRDFIGTGVYSSEYVVATKSFGPKVRVSAGLGWGRLGTSGDLGSPFGERTGEFEVTGGTANLDQLFKGPVAPFAGIAYQPTKKLTLKAEYSSDDYAYEEGRGLIDRESPWNFAAEYRFDSGAAVQAGYLYGSEFALQLSFALNAKNPKSGPGNEAGPLPIRPRPSRAADPEAWDTAWVTDSRAAPVLTERVATVLAKDGIVVESMALSSGSAEIRLRNTRFNAQPQALGRTARVLSRALPASVETFVLVPVADGVPLSKIVLKRSDLEALENAPSGAIRQRADVRDAAGPKPVGLTYAEGQYPRFTWSLSPYVELSYFDPDAPVRGDIGLRLSAQFDIAPGWVASGSVRKRLVGNLNEITRESNSVLPRVRSDFANYLREADPAIDRLQLAYYGRPATNLYSRVTVGYLERAYGGISGELLWKPVDSRLALGAEVNYVKKREYEQLFGFQDYEIVTGHASAYYDFGNGFHGQLDVGRYLAGDWGATIAFDREFANGWKVGAFATFTDVSFEDFGEGSFDKGIRVEIPFDYFTGKPSRQTLGTTIRPLTRDGGARLNVSGRLYGKVRESHSPELAKTWGKFWR